MSTIGQDYRAVLPRLLGLYPSLSEVRLKASHRALTHVAHGWYMRCHRGVAAVLQLESDNLQEEAGPIRRSILEHVVALKWLAEQGNAVTTTLKRGAFRDAEKRKSALHTANWTSVDLELFESVINDGKNLDGQNDNLIAFKHRCDQFGTPHDWATYLNETARCHPSWESAVPYLDLRSDEPIALNSPAPLIDQAGFCALHLLKALIAVNEMLQEAPFSAELDDIGRQARAIAVRQRHELELPIPPELARDIEVS